MTAWRRLGDTGVLVELAGLDEVLALDAAVRAEMSRGSTGLAVVMDVLPAARTLAVTVPAGTDLGRVADEILALAGDPGADAATGEVDEVEIAVHYDGPDLDEIASLTGLSITEVVEAHTGTPWRVAFGGFAPGFFYLVDGDPRLTVPRRSEPRTAVPPGSVGLAGEFSGIYPRASPGGWQLLGHVDEALWDVERDPPALLRPGQHVRFAAAPAAPAESATPAESTTPAESAAPAGPSYAPGESAAPGASPDAAAEGRPVTPSRSATRSAADQGLSHDRGSLTVLATGPRALLQDQGRPGLAHLGVGRSGAADRAAHALGQRLLGNELDCAAVEVTLGGLAVRAEADCLVTVTGAPAPAHIDDRPVGHAAVLRLVIGQVLRLGAPAYGLRSYLSVRGGIDVPPVLGSRSTDTLAGLGPDPLEDGDVLPIGDAARALPTTEQAPLPGGPPARIVLRVVPGPRVDWLADREVLVATPWEVSARSDRIGARLVGETLVRHPDHEGEELLSEGVVRGSVQVPPGGEPVLFLADHPVTGGYPVAAVVVDDDVDLAAQLRPGDRLRLAWHPTSRPATSPPAPGSETT
ncbi:5-oxoprolinase/urea amidolyase family protein [Arsenicicoccus sp. UBA2120]|uniref:5-oxoprolinase subunit B/C family protein n=1 Tax=Arsenicicoccus sp. UBA2120 TaxID=1946055 RepID=UPI00257DD6F2|nr:5-oxoprolinase/urea amidolyase family protein [Arsenicicoccus sp. UBA2120]